MRIKLYTLAIVVLFAAACGESVGEASVDESPYGEANVNAASLERDFVKWWTYFNEHTILSDDFIGLDTAMQHLSKGDFLAELTTGAYIPIKLDAKDVNTYLKLHPLSENADKDVVATIMNKATSTLVQFEMEGSPFPNFDFVSLDGEQFNNDNTKGKLLVLKCWFIGCKACVEEFPELNQLVDENSGRSDVAFLSLAYDRPEALRKFVGRKEFKYAVLPVERDFLETQLQVVAYPTHFVVDKEGIIKKVVNNVEALKAALEKEW